MTRVRHANARIVVTGTGVISALGHDCAANVQALRAATVGVGPLRLFDTSDHKTHLAAEVPNFVPEEHVPAELRGQVTRTDALALVAAREALAQAGFSTHPLGARAGLVLGGTTGGMLETEAFFASVAPGHRPVQQTQHLVSHPLSAPTDAIAQVLGINGPRRTVCSACSSGVNAIATGMALLRDGSCDVVLAGGADALCRLTFAGFNALGAVDAGASRPFHAKRAGLTLGEGAGFLVLERLEDALARNATVLAEVRGVGVVSEAHHITHPDPSGDGARRAMVMALEHANVHASEVDYVNAHGTGTPLNDPMESAALGSLFGYETGRPYVSSTKSMTGHTLGAAGAIEAVICVLAMREQFTPPTASLDVVEPQCAHLALVRTEQTHEHRELHTVLSNSFGFGGADAVVCLTSLAKGNELAARTQTQQHTNGAHDVVVTGYTATHPRAHGHMLLDALLAGDALHGDPVAQTPLLGLDPARARRLDPLALMATRVAHDVLQQARYEPELRDRTGVVFGTAWGSLDGSAAFIRRVSERGARLAPPADFPNLVLSAAAGHVSIYHGLRGPSLTTAAMSLSGEHAVALALDELVAGRADIMLAGAIDVRNPVMLEIIDEVDSLWADRNSAHPRSEAASCLVLETVHAAVKRGAAPLARLTESVSLGYTRESVPWNELLQHVATTCEETDLVIVPTLSQALQTSLKQGHFQHARIIELAPALGHTESLGGVAVALAVHALQRTEARRVLVLGHAPGQLHALSLARVS